MVGIDAGADDAHDDTGTTRRRQRFVVTVDRPDGEGDLLARDGPIVLIGVVRLATRAYLSFSSAWKNGFLCWVSEVANKRGKKPGVQRIYMWSRQII